MIPKEAIQNLLKQYDPNMESYFTAEDPSDYDWGNFDDAVQHGYDAGYNAALGELAKIFNELSL